MNNKDDKSRPGGVPAGLDNLDDIELPSMPSGAAVPRGGNLGGKETMRRLLDGNALDLTDEESKGSARRIQPNPGGLKKGYDPYDSGMLLKKQWNKKKDLRALSKWIEQKKKLDGED